MSESVEEFLRQYEQRQDYYARVADRCGHQLEKALRDAGIRAIVSSRAKKLNSLRDKLEQRNSERRAAGESEYTSVEEIDADIPDLAGARVAVYFPGDISLANDLIAREFIASVPVRYFPRTERPARPNKRFSGYQATHHRVRLRPESLSPDELRYSTALCEVQVASVLMHAWAEVEHDLEYKSLTGPISASESALLDQINGLVHSGEIALSQLQESIRRRLLQRTSSLRDAYDVVNWLREIEASAYRYGANHPRRDAGEPDYAFRLMKRLGLTNQSDLVRFEGRLAEAFRTEDAKLTLIDVLVDTILRIDPAFASGVREAQAEASEAYAFKLRLRDRHVESAIGSFVRRWQELEWTAQGLLIVRGVAPVQTLPVALNALGLPQDVIGRALAFRDLRNGAVHGTAGFESVAGDTAVLAKRELEAILNAMCRHVLEPVFQTIEQSSPEPRTILALGSAIASPRRELVGLVVSHPSSTTNERLARASVLLGQNRFWPAGLLVEVNGNWTFQRWTNADRPVLGRRSVIFFGVPWFSLETARREGVRSVSLETLWTSESASVPRVGETALGFTDEPPMTALRPGTAPRGY